MRFMLLQDYAPTESEDTETLPDALDWQTGAAEEDDQQDAVEVFTVTNPPDTVSVSVLIDGSIQRVSLSPKVVNMSESDLAEEVLVIADLARQKGCAGAQTALLEGASPSEAMGEFGEDGSEVVRDFLENGLGLVSPEQAQAAQAEVFATRYRR